MTMSGVKQQPIKTISKLSINIVGLIMFIFFLSSAVQFGFDMELVLT